MPKCFLLVSFRLNDSAAIMGLYANWNEELFTPVFNHLNISHYKQSPDYWP